MTEPNYVYVKGQGWLVETYPTAIVTFHDGKKAKIELRTPVKGEFYRYASAAWSLDMWEAVVSDHDYNKAHALVAHKDDPQYEVRKVREKFTYCVVTYL